MALTSNPPKDLPDLLQKLGHEPSPLTRRWLLLAAKDWWSAETVTRFYDEALRLLHVDIPQAERIARSAVWLAENLGDDTARAAGMRALGHIFWCSLRNHLPTGISPFWP